MSNNHQSAENGSPNLSAQARSEAVSSQAAKARRGRYPDMQSAVRFPIKLPVAVKSKGGQSHAETQNISANGVLIQVDAEMPVGSMVDFTISLPAEIMGSETDVQLDCRGRVVRSFEESGHRGVGVVIDEYKFDRR